MAALSTPDFQVNTDASGSNPNPTPYTPEPADICKREWTPPQIRSLSSIIDTSLVQRWEATGTTLSPNWPLRENTDLNTPPDTERFEVDNKSLQATLGIDLDRIKRYLTKARDYGSSSPRALCFGSAAREIAASGCSDYDIPPTQRRFNPETSDFDLVLPPKALDNPIFAKHETTWTTPDHRHPSTLLRSIRLIEDDTTANDRYHLFAYKTHPESTIHPLQLINLMIPQEPLIQFELTEEDIIEAQIIVIKRQEGGPTTTTDPYNPENVGIRAYSSAINDIADTVTSSDKAEDEHPISAFQPAKALLEPLKEWSYIASRQEEKRDFPEDFRTLTRELSLRALNIVLAAERNYEYFKNNPQASIEILGKTGLLSLIFQSCLFLGYKPQDILGKYSRLFMDAIETLSPEEKAKFSKVTDSTSYRHLSKQRFPNGDLPITSPYYNQYADLGLRIAQLNPEIFDSNNNHKVQMQYPHIILSTTWLAARIKEDSKFRIRS